MENVKSEISKHNHQILRHSQNIENTVTSGNCNCKVKTSCPLQGNCLTKNIIYKAEVSTSNENDVKEYIGMTATTFKERYRNHKTSINNKHYTSETELSKYVWKQKNSGKTVSIKWSILRHAAPRKPGSRRCNLCLTEKLCILRADQEKTLNKRTELFSKCCHRNKFNAGNFNYPTNNCKTKRARKKLGKRMKIVDE